MYCLVCVYLSGSCERNQFSLLNQHKKVLIYYCSKDWQHKYCTLFFLFNNYQKIWFLLWNLSLKIVKNWYLFCIFFQEKRFFYCYKLSFIIGSFQLKLPHSKFLTLFFKKLIFLYETLYPPLNIRICFYGLKFQWKRFSETYGICNLNPPRNCAGAIVRLVSNLVSWCCP